MDNILFTLFTLVASDKGLQTLCGNTTAWLADAPLIHLAFSGFLKRPERVSPAGGPGSRVTESAGSHGLAFRRMSDCQFCPSRGVVPLRPRVCAGVHFCLGSDLFGLMWTAFSQSALLWERHITAHSSGWMAELEFHKRLFTLSL